MLLLLKGKLEKIETNSIYSELFLQPTFLSFFNYMQNFIMERSPMSRKNQCSKMLLPPFQNKCMVLSKIDILEYHFCAQNILSVFYS